MNREIKFTQVQRDRIDEVYEATLDYCKILTQNNDLEWNMEFIGEIADCAAEILTELGNRIYFPSIIHDDDGNYVVDFYDESKISRL